MDQDVCKIVIKDLGPFPFSDYLSHTPGFFDRNKSTLSILLYLEYPGNVLFVFLQYLMTAYATGAIARF